MEPFTVHTGIVLPLDRIDVNTDEIIPQRFLKAIGRTGFGPALFHSWRYLTDGSANPEFVLNDPRYRGAGILAAGRNFGSGSSREHAVWSLQQCGFRAVVAPSFADIFRNNCYQNGLLPVALPEAVVRAVIARAKDEPGFTLTIDLERQSVSDGDGQRGRFEIDPAAKHRLLHGLDAIALTLQHQALIREYEARRPSFLPRTRA